MLAYLLAVALIATAGPLAYAAAPLQSFHGTLLVLIIVLIAIAVLIVAVAIFLYFRSRKLASGAPGGNEPTDLDVLLKDAARKLRSSRQGGAKSLATMPLLYVIGGQGSAKTTTVAQSGLDPELIAGQAYRTGDVAPTPLINIWYTRHAGLIEAGEALRADTGLLDRLVYRTRPKAYRSAFGTGAPARAAVVCVSIEQFLGADAGITSMDAARSAGAQLRQISRALGTALPVYVILTKLDRVPYFPEFARNLSNEEAQQVLGTTLPKGETPASVYTDQAIQQLGNAFDRICFSLSEFRLEMLARETNQKSAAEVYEFPRELRKLRNNLVQYLVELCKPSHLDANPYLRGFYFTGVRAQIIEQAVSTPALAPKAAPQDAGATRMFSLQELQQPAPAQPQTVSRKAPQWVFLPRLFPQVILGDRSALFATRQTAPARHFRRALFTVLAALLAIYSVLLIFSYRNNASLQKRILAADQALAVSNGTGAALPAIHDLQTLDQLRSEIVQLEQYQQDGPPLMYRWGLYQGNHLAASARRIYFARFRQMFLNAAQGNLLTYLRSLPDAPAAGADYTASYNALKAYLITTSNPEKSSAEFLAPVFMQYWTAGRPISPDQQQLARRQVDFYADELLRRNPYTITPDTAAVSHARNYLSKFGAVPRIYQDMLTAAGKSAPPIDFNRQYPGSSQSVVETHIVPGAFTKAAFSFMQAAIQNPQRYFKGETWVLGEQAAPSLEAASITSQLNGLYSGDYIKEWHSFLTDAHVVSCGNLHEAPARLNALASPSSPLLELFYVVSHNTAVADRQIAGVFASTQALVDPNAVNRYIGPGNTNYINALLTLSGVVMQVAQNPASASDPSAGAPIHATATAADTVTRQIYAGFSIDPVMHTENTVLALLEAPIKCADGLAAGVGKAGIVAAGQSVCSAFHALAGKFPFSPNASAQATVAEVSSFFAPGTGTLWKEYDASFKPLLIQQGTHYVPAPTAPFHVTSGFTTFFNRAAAISASFFPPPATTPELTFTLHQVPTKGIQSASLAVDGQRISGENATQQFTWNAATAQEAELSYNSGQALQFHGTWALFQLLSKARATRAGGVIQLEFPLEISNVPLTLPDGTPEVVRFDLSGTGADLLAPGALNNLRCVGPLGR